MVAPMGVLCGAGFAGHFYAGNRRPTTGTGGHHHFHALKYCLKVPRFDFGIDLFVELRVQTVFPSNSPDNMWANIVPFVSDDSQHVSHLQRCDGRLTLPDAHRHHRIAVPAVVIFLVEIFGRRNAAFQFVGQVCVKHLQKAHGSHIIQPCGIGLVDIFVFGAVGEDVVEGAAEEGVTRALDGTVDVQSAAVVAVNHVTANMVTAAGAGIDRSRSDDMVL